MKILHTADWHLGKELHQHSLEEDHSQFLDWLYAFIRDKNVEVLLIAGDVFDHANPPNEARKVYFNFLKSMALQQVRVIITGGNHDSVNMLSAPGELMSLLNIHIVAGASDQVTDEIIEIKDKTGNIQAICAAVPYLRDRDLRNLVTGATQEDRTAVLRQGIKGHYAACHTFIEETYQKRYPVIAMGHLYLQGSTTSESEREIQLGNAAGVDASGFEGMFDYMALGHIHIPQRFAKGKIRYSGSPIALSFSERKDQKTVVLLETIAGGLDIQSIQLPVFRRLLKIEGNWKEVQFKLDKIEDDLELKPLIEVEVFEDISMVSPIENGLEMYKEKGLKIVKRRIRSSGGDAALAAQLDWGTNLRELNPMIVFEKN
ncbi:MAG: exonuclease subunit SbcD [Saprospiraceae bacterium]|nr:exonuclease subunit SbcD [Saprospiraceae bacterium]